VELLERENELTVLGEALAMAKAGNGRLLVIEGVAGNGKSALLATLSTRARAQGLRVLAARGGELERGFAFGTIRQLFEKLLTSADSEERDRLLGGAAEAAATIVARSPGASDRVPSTFAVLHAIYWLSANLAAETPLLIVVDDLHWVDPSSVA
jgi:predicted ATPase